MAEQYKSPLDKTEFTKASDVTKYGDLLRKVGRVQQGELHWAADELQAVLSVSGGTLWNRMETKRRARRVAKYLRRAADHQRSMAVLGVQLARAFRREYAPLLDPPKGASKRAMDMKS